MNCQIIKMKQQGVGIPKRELSCQLPMEGDLSITETRSEDLHRLVRFARLQRSEVGNQGCEERLYDPNILWMNEGRFVLTGFERIGTSRGTMHLSQSWLCIVRTR
jgi:hypothetical protein